MSLAAIRLLNVRKLVYQVTDLPSFTLFTYNKLMYCGIFLSTRIQEGQFVAISLKQKTRARRTTTTSIYMTEEMINNN